MLAAGLDDASSLMFHHVFIGDDRNSPVIFVWGEDSDPAFHCEFRTKMSDNLTFNIEEFKDAPWYETIKKHMEDE